MTRSGRLSAILRRRFAGAAARLARRGTSASLSDAEAFEAVRRAFLSAEGIEPTSGRHRPAGGAEAARDAAVDAPGAEPDVAGTGPGFLVDAPGAEPDVAATPPAFAAVTPATEAGELETRPPLAAVTPATDAGELETRPPLAVVASATDAPGTVPPPTATRGTWPAFDAPTPVVQMPERATATPLPPARALDGSAPAPRVDDLHPPPASPGTPTQPTGLRASSIALVVLGVSLVAALGIAMVAGGALAPWAGGAVASPAPVTPSPSAAASRPAALPDGVRAGLLQVGAVNDRLARATADLKAGLAVKRPSAAEVAPLLRKVAADARAGQEGAARVGTWPGAGALPADLASFYKAVAAAAADGLGAPLTDDAAYAAAGRRMLKTLVPLPVLDRATRDAAARVGVVLPAPVPTPAIAPSPAG